MKTIVLKCKQNFYLIPLLFFIALLFTTCDKEPVKTYYKIKGYGYAFDTLNNVPLANAKLVVITCTDGEAGLFGDEPAADETYYTDSNGYFEIKFLKRYGSLKAIEYHFELHYIINNIEYFDEFLMDVEKVKNVKENIFFDVIRIPQYDPTNPGTYKKSSKFLK